MFVSNAYNMICFLQELV